LDIASCHHCGTMMTSRPCCPPILGALLTLLLAVLGACGGGGSDGTPAAPTVPTAPVDPGSSGITDTTAYSTDGNASLATATEAKAVTQHSLNLASGNISYTATAGHLTANELTSGTAQASFFYVAYTATGASAGTPATRPVTFFFNGGPGSASMWLHMGSYGPKRLATHMPSNQIAASFAVVDNTESLIDVSDLVFVDAVGTGHSEAIAPNTNSSFWGVDADVRVFRDFIARYMAVNGRTASPRVLFGESYGTLRAAILAEELMSSGVGVDGVVLLSSVLDYNSNCGVVDDARNACGGYLPSYAATSAYFNRALPPPADVNAFLLQAMSFADERYGPAVSAYLAGTAQPSAALVGELSAMTGLATTLWQSQFNLGPDTYRSSLLPGQLLGRYDARISGAVGGPVAADGDPSLTVIEAPYVAATRAYLQDQLAYRSSANYASFSNAIQVWKFGHDGKPLPDAIPDLATAMTLNPKLRVLSLNGHHDLATPFHQTVQDLRRLGLQSRITLQHVAGGHMTYLDDSSRRLQRAALADFYRSLRAPQ
jgi:carboxypeptidase C (cathepsin A)